MVHIKNIEKMNITDLEFIRDNLISLPNEARDYMKAIEQVYPEIEKNSDEKIVLLEENPYMYIKGIKLHISHNGYFMIEMTVDNIFKELLAIRLSIASGNEIPELLMDLLNFLKETKMKADKLNS